jgi:hypothetical protein
VERLRAENQMRENMLSENLRRQQAAIARNVQRYNILLISLIYLLMIKIYNLF